ncbi:MAG TPA: diguanylate cyclase [Deltaproteobacteria bacterium]|jgi:diguanylate cyclase (GGDEF)-like protein|nr:diguanylate cyclase [Deltaproteobacteria bacterium]HQI00058.1 diguanylate cyclase [Deltaproteobacteria bacterium]HQJ07560.1 diguanylate cyclase [Deltaproteobacteria bacterium]
MKTVIIVKESLDESLSSIVSSSTDLVQVIRSDGDISSLISMDPPDLILVDRTYLAEHGGRIVEKIRSSTIHGHLPIIAVYRKEDLERNSSIDIPIDDFIVLGGSLLETKRRIEFASRRVMREMGTNPLTRMPGNEAIIRCIQRMLDQEKEVAFAWVDLDSFKPYNGRYGFSSGDEVILATSRVITNAVREIDHEDTFVGHAGGDVFVFVCPIGSVRKLCEEIISRFDMVIRNFYSEEDLERKGIVSTSRNGEKRMFPVMTISIAVAMNEQGRYKHYGEVSQIAAEVRSYVKGLEGSNYMIDRRGKTR